MNKIPKKVFGSVGGPDILNSSPVDQSKTPEANAQFADLARTATVSALALIGEGNEREGTQEIVQLGKTYARVAELSLYYALASGGGLRHAALPLPTANENDESPKLRWNREVVMSTDQCTMAGCSHSEAGAAIELALSGIDSNEQHTVHTGSKVLHGLEHGIVDPTLLNEQPVYKTVDGVRKIAGSTTPLQELKVILDTVQGALPEYFSDDTIDPGELALELYRQELVLGGDDENSVASSMEKAKNNIEVQREFKRVMSGGGDI